MAAFIKTLTGKNGKNFDVVMPGSTVVGKPKKDITDDLTVDVFLSKLKIGNIDLEKEYGWKRKSTIHTHPQSLHTTFSNIKDNGIRGTEYRGDIPFAIQYDMNIYLVTKSQIWIQKFDISKYKELNPKGLDANWNDHTKATLFSTDEKYRPFMPKQ